MERRHYLVADDEPAKRAALERSVRASAPYGSIVHVADSVRQASRIIKIFGEHIERGVIDFDFLPEHRNGGEIIKELKAANRTATAICVTARPEGASLEEARDITSGVGATATYCFLNEETDRSIAEYVTAT